PHQIGSLMFSKQIPPAVKSDGTQVPYEPGKCYKLGVGTYYIDCSMPDAVNSTVHCAWDATLVANVSGIVVQTSGMSAFASLSHPYSDNAAAADVTNITPDTNGLWLTQNPSTAYVPCVNGAVTNMTVKVAGG